MGARSDSTYAADFPFIDRDGTSHPMGVTTEVVTSAVNLTLTQDDSGKIIVITGADKVVTLPATQEGLVYTIVTGATSVTTGLSVSPVAADRIIGLGFTAADDKDAINTQATERVGDSITLVGNGSTGWLAIRASGTWAREA